MKQERKEALLRAFPSVPEEITSIMSANKRITENFVVLLTNGEELFARCFHKYSRGELIERQRYVFARDGYCRYGLDLNNNWVVRKDFREPIFSKVSYGGCFDNSYQVLNYKALERSCMKYSCAESMDEALMEYLRLYCKHPNIEYLIKSHYGGLIEEVPTYSWIGSYVCNVKLQVNSLVNLKSNNLLKMLGLNRTEFKLLQGHEIYYEDYCRWREKHPEYKPDKLLLMAKAFGCESGTVESLEKLTDVRLPRIAQYLDDVGINVRDYIDYLRQCRELQYNTSDTAISLPHDFNAMHARLSKIIEYRQSEEMRRLFDENYPQRKELEFAGGKYIIRQPESLGEIISEGKALSHCVGGYAERHARGKLHILFIRQSDKPNKPYYTMELSTDGRIVQVRGLSNCAPPESVQKFIEQYKRHISNVFKKARKTA